MGLKLYLNNEEFRFTNRYTIREQVGQPASSSIDVLISEGQSIPLTHTKVELKENGTTIFLGYVLTTETPTFASSYETFIVPMQVVASETLFTRRLVSDVWQDKFTHEIVTDIYNDYLVEEGLTLGTIETFENKYDNFVVPNLRMSDVLQELADDIGAVAFITVDNEFNFISKGNFPNVEPPAKLTGLKLSETGQDLKTIQKISGAKAETSIKTLAVVWAVDQKNIPLGYQLADEPTVTVNSSTVEVGVQGVDDDNTNKVFLWKYGNNSIVLNSNATSPPSTGDNIAVVFKGFFDIEIQAENESLKEEIFTISGTSGKIESIVVDTSITSTQDGETKANNLLNEKGVREQTVNLSCHDVVKSNLLNTWTLNYPSLGIDGNFVIVERTITDFYDDKYKVNLKLKNRGFYQRYGTAFNKDIKQINNLSIRSDKKVFKNSTFNDSIQWSEEWQVNENLMTFTCGTTDIFSPVFFDGLTPARG